MFDFPKSLAGAQTHLAFAVTHLEKNAPSAAAASFGDAAVSLRQSLLQAYIQHAASAFAADEFSSARVASSHATALEPTSSLAWYWVGAVAMREKRFVDAKNAFGNAVENEKELARRTEYLDWKRKAVEADDVALGKAPAEESRRAGGVAGPDVAAAFEKDRQEDAIALGADATLVNAKRPSMGPKLDWYQSGGVVSVDLFVKNVVREKCSIKIEERCLYARLVREGEEDQDAIVVEKKLFGVVVPAESSWSASKYKVEVKLRKRDDSTWKQLEAIDSGGADGTGTEDALIAQQSGREEAGVSGAERRPDPLRPGKNWDAIVDDELKDAQQDEGPMALFRTIYADADEDTQRAMMKSYQESGGKVLSTDWKDVGSRKVEWKEDEKK